MADVEFDAEAVLQAVMDYNMARIEHKMLVLDIDFNAALAARMAEIMNEDAPVDAFSDCCAWC
jgi:hypothetical protein